MSICCPECGSSVDFVQLNENNSYCCPRCAATAQFLSDRPSTTVFPGSDTPDGCDPADAFTARHPTLGRFQLLNELGHGGFGTVYRAHDTQLDRTVALKIPHGGTIVTPDEKSRFLREGQTAAALEHPGIVRVFDAGEINRTPYISSQLVKGKTLANYVLARKLSHRECAEMIAQIAEALEHAHQRKLVHRDVKPSNVMVREDGRPMLMDFGLAKDFERDRTLTSEGHVKGTPAYMSPEQAAGETSRIDRRTDVYSLGIVMYELLTGERPFRGTRDKIIDQIRNDEPRQPRSFNSKIPLDLQTICQKAMEKSPSRRYHTAQEFADDLTRWLRSEPIAARRISHAGRAVRWCRRNSGVAVSLSTIFLILSSATAVATSLYLGEREAVQDATRRLSQLMVANAALNTGGDLLGALPWLAEAYRLDKGDETRESISRDRLESALRECPKLEAAWFHGAPIDQLALSHDRHRFASASVDGVVRIWDLATGKQLHEFLIPSGEIRHLEFLPDDRHVVATPSDRSVRVWDVDSGREVAQTSLPASVSDLQVGPAGDLIAVAHGDCARLWRWQQKGPEAVRVVAPLKQVISIAFDPRGKLLAIGGMSGTIRFWDLDSAQLLERALIHPRTATSIAYSHNGKILAAATTDRKLLLWDTDTYLPVHDPPLEVSLTTDRIEFTPDDSLIATLARSGRKKSTGIFNLKSGIPTALWIPHERPVNQIDVSPDGRLILTACDDGYVRFWNTQTGELDGMPFLQGGPVLCAAFLDNTRILTAGYDRCIRRWAVAADITTVKLPVRDLDNGHPSPDLSKLLVGSKDGRACVFTLDGRMTQLDSCRHDAMLSVVAFAADGSLFVTGCVDGTARIWDTNSGMPVTEWLRHPRRVEAVCFSPDASQLATACGDNIARIWNSHSGVLEHQIPQPDQIRDVAVTATGKYLATAGRNGSVYLFELGADSKDRTVAVFPQTSARLVPHPTEDLLLTTAPDRIVRVWDCESMRLLVSFDEHTAAIQCAAFSSDGHRVVSASEDGTARIWDPRTGELLTRPLPHNTAVCDAAFSPDQCFVVTGTVDGAVRVWDAQTSEPVTPPLRLRDEVVRCWFCQDSSTVVALTSEGGLLVYRLRDPAFRKLNLANEAIVLSGHQIYERGGFGPVAADEYRILAKLRSPSVTPP